MDQPDATLDALLAHLGGALMAPWTLVSEIQSPLFWGYLASALVFASLIFAWRARRSGLSLRGLAAFLFPRSVWLNPSAVLDYKFLAVDTALFALIFAPLLISAYAVADLVYFALADNFGPPVLTRAAGTGACLAFTIALVVAVDFARYASHWCFHRFPVLWEFHKVHHSARVLTPATLARAHPFERMIFATAIGVAFGAVLGAFEYVYPQGLTLFSVLGVNVVVFGFNLWANLSHSHVWLSFGRLFEHVILSPAQHQIHHSAAPEHRDRNLGSLLAVWDWMFRTLYVPHDEETLTLGLGNGEEVSFQTLPQLYGTPCRRIWAMGREAWESRRDRMRSLTPAWLTILRERTTR